MIQPNGEQPVVAHEMLWQYRGLTEEPMEGDFFAALDKTVSAEISQRLLTRRMRMQVGYELHLNIGPYAVQAQLTNIEPVLATAVDEATRVIAQYRQRGSDAGQDTSTFLAEIIRYPNEQLGVIFDGLVGLSEVQDDLFRKLTLLIGPHYLDSWLRHTYANNPPRLLTQILRDRYPLILLEGEVGAGKTALARSIGHPLAIRLNTEIALFVVNAQVRGGGHVGELTQNIARAFREAERCQEREQIPVILLIDEADALAQARGQQQTHHEDDAGVNTLIQCIDRLRGRPMAVLFATNLVQVLDAAIMRRAIVTYHFKRPGGKMRLAAFRRILTDVGIREDDMAQLIALTEPKELPGFGATRHRYTYSDIVQRIVPRAVEEAVYDQQALSIRHLRDACAAIQPTPEMHTGETTASRTNRERRYPGLGRHAQRME
jgi:hypothetical protein